MLCVSFRTLNSSQSLVVTLGTTDCNTKRFWIFPKPCLDQALRYKHFSAGTFLLPQTSPCGVCNRKSGSGKDFPQSILVFPNQLSFHQFSIIYFIQLLQTRYAWF